MRVLVTGASGQLGGYLLRELAARNVETVAWSGSRHGSIFGAVLRPVDLADHNAVAAAFRQARPDVVIHAGALARVMDCFREPEHARLVNTQSSASIAELAAEAGVRLLYVSTDLVFDGERGNYREDDAATPLSVYGRTKADAERAVRSAPLSLVVRTSLLFGPSVIGRTTFFDEQVTAARNGKPIALSADEWRTPLSLKTAASALVALAQSKEAGILHLGGPERMSRLEMGERLAAFLGVGRSFIRAVRRDEAPSEEPRPRDTSLDSSRWRALHPDHPWPSWEAALAEFFDSSC
jgi:dTDP-4-dehydrorhamnose reductase